MVPPACTADAHNRGGAAGATAPDKPKDLADEGKKTHLHQAST